MDEPTASGAAVEETPAWVPDPATAKVHSPARPADPPEDDQAAASSSGDDDEVTPDSTPEVGKRAYVVLEVLDLLELLEEALPATLALSEEQGAALVDEFNSRGRSRDVCLIVGESESGNGTHALRHVAKANFDAGTRPTLAAVPARNFRPKPVTVSADTRVTVG